MYRQIVAEYHSDNRNKLFASYVFICFHCFLSSKNSLNFSLSRKYPKIIIQLRRVGYQTCKFFFTSIKIIHRKRLLKLFAGIKQLWLFAWSSCWFWISTTLLQCLEETEPNTGATMENVSLENMEEEDIVLEKFTSFAT